MTSRFSGYSIGGGPMTRMLVPIAGIFLIADACNGSHARTPGPPNASSTGDTAVPARPSAAAPSLGSLSALPSTPEPTDSTPAPAVAVFGSHTWSFDTDTMHAPPRGFSFGRTGSGGSGRWVILADKDAPSGAQVLAQMEADDKEYRFPIAVADEPLMRDGSVRVRCKPVSGHTDRACGLVFRYRDADNYYVTRANALENNVRLYHVVKGDRRQFAGWNGKVATGQWHFLRVDAKGDHFQVYWEDKKVIDAHDITFPEAGKVGLWTKADSITYFDDLRVAPLP